MASVINRRRDMSERLLNQQCPRCGCEQSSGVDGEPLIRCCVACHDVFGFDDTMSPENELFNEEHVAGAVDSEWDDDTFGSRHHHCVGEFDESGCGENSESWSGSSHGGGGGDCACRFDGDCCGNGRAGNTSGCSERGGSSSQNKHQQQQQQHLGRSRSTDQTSQLLDSGLQLAGHLLGGESSPPPEVVARAASAATEQLEPIGQSVGALIGGFAGNMIASTRGAELGTNMGATVGRDVAEMLRDSAYFPAGPGGRGVSGRQH